ncbi:MAG: tol-pal system-associated acyl-CoA thioesterase [Alphaproteobacteria bacterium]
MKPHSFPTRVYYEDTDAGGVVYHANFIKFCERARTELLRLMGFENKSLRESQGILFVVRHINADYFKPGGLDDLLDVQTIVTQVKNTSLVMKHSICRNDEMLFSCHVTVVCVDAGSVKPVRIPEGLRPGFLKFLKKGD